MLVPITVRATSSTETMHPFPTGLAGSPARWRREGPVSSS